MRYVSLHVGIWRDPEFRALSHQAQRAWLRIRLDPRMGLSGVLVLRPDAIGSLLDLGSAELERVLSELCEAGGGVGIEVDLRRGAIWVRGAFARTPSTRSPTTQERVLRELRDIPQGSPMLERWLDRHESRLTTNIRRNARKIASPLGPENTGNSDTLYMGYRKGFPTLSSISAPAHARAHTPTRAEPSPTPDPDSSNPEDRKKKKTPQTPRSARARVPKAARALVDRFAELVGWKPTDATYRFAGATYVADGGDRMAAAIDRYAAELLQDRPARKYRIRTHNWFGRDARWRQYDGEPAGDRVGGNGWNPKCPDEHRHLIEIIDTGTPRPPHLTPSELQTWTKLLADRRAWNSDQRAQERAQKG